MHAPLPLFDTDALRTLESRGAALLEGDAFAGVLVTSLPGGGTLERSSDGVVWAAVGAGDFVSAADVAAGHLRYSAGGAPTSSSFDFGTYQWL